MSLSTSSSRAIYFKVLLAIALGMGAALGIVRLIAYMNDASSETILGRVMEAKSALPQITDEPEELVMFFGSSMVQAGFSPRQFDRELAEQGVEVSSWNFGFGGLNPLFQDYLSRRIKESFEEKDRRLKLAMIEFNPFQTTMTRRDRARAAEDSFFTMLGTNEELWDVTMDDPKRGIRLFNIRYLRDSISAEMATTFFGQVFVAPRTRTEIPEDEELEERRNELGEELTKRFEEDYPDYVPSNWSYEWQGGGTIPEERSEETLAIFEEYYATFQNDHGMDDDRLSRIHTADIEDLNFDEELVDAFIRIVKNFQQFSDHVEVIMLPKNTKWIKNPPEALARQQRVIEKIARETGVTIRDFQDLPQMTPEMFGDTTHLNRYSGQVVFTDHLIDEYSPILKR